MKLYVSGSSSAHLQEFIHCTLQFHPGPARKLSTNLYDTYQYRVYSE